MIDVVVKAILSLGRSLISFRLAFRRGLKKL